MDSLLLGVKSINSSMKSEGAAIALYDALKKPHCLQLILRLLPELSERQSFIQVFTLLLKEEETNYPEILPMSNSLIANYCPVTYTLVSELVETNANGYVGELVAQLLATQSNPLLVIRLVSEQCQ